MSESTKSTEERAKFSAEAEAARALARKYEAEGSLMTAQALEASHRAALAAIQRSSAERAEREMLTSNKYHHLYTFNEGVSAASVKTCIDQLSQWMRLPQDGEPAAIEILFNSPGGSVIDGMALFDWLQSVRAGGHHVTTSTVGYAASMAGILLQAGDTRVMGREAYVLIHEVSFGAQGKPGEVEDEVKFVRMIQERVLDIFVKRARPINAKTTKEFLRKRWARRDWWIDSSEALRLGLVDAVR